MKSSSNGGSPALHSDVRTWQPPELTVPVSSSAVEDRVDEVLSIFAPFGGDEGAKAPRTRQTPARVQPWVPEDLLSSRFAEWSGVMDERSSLTTDEPDSSVDPDRESSKQAALEAEASAQAILEATQAQAEALLQQAQREADVIREQAYQAARQEAEAELRGLIQTVQNMVAEVETWRQDLFAQGEAMVLETVQAIARALFGEGFALDSETLQQTYNRVLEQAQTLGDLRVYVNVEDARALDPYWREAQATLRDQRIKLIPTDAIKRGGCYVEGQYGTVDGRIEVRLNRLLAGLLTEDNPPSE